MRTIIALLSAVVACTACAIPGSDAVVGCDFRDVDEGLNNGDEARCQERTGLGATGFAATCEGLGGTASDDGCDRDGIVFGCNLGESGNEDVIDWYYAPKTADDATLECGGDTIVDAP